MASERLQGLSFELRVEQVMTRNMVTVRSSDSLQQVKDLLRQHRISGTPVVDADSSKLVGIVSVEDVIMAADSGQMNSLVGDSMTRNVVTIRSNEPVAEAIKKFARHKFGRLPVVEEGRLVGILTPGDVMTRLLTALERRYRDEVERGQPRRCFAELVSDDTAVTLRFEIPARDFNKAGTAATRLRRGLLALGVDQSVIRRATVAAYEAEMNIVIHSAGGYIRSELRPKRILIEAVDTGPGIPDVDQALQAGYTTASDWIRELGFGAGMGLTNIQNCADEFRIESQMGTGTRVEAIFYLEAVS